MKKYLHTIWFAILFVSCAETIDNDERIKYSFVYQSTTAKEVSIAGSFNNWSAKMNPLTNEGNGKWKVDIELEPNYYQYKFVVDSNWLPDPANDWKINDGGTSFNSIVKVGDPKVPKRKKNKRPFPKEQLPTPILESQPELVDLYYAAWQMAWNKIQEGTAENGFEPYYMDEGFNELIYQWDICFITGFGVYGRDVFPVMPSLDNFYNKQRDDGYIQRVYWETNGEIANEPTVDEPMVNPPLFAWIEWRYYQISGDNSRFKRVLPVLTKYFEWTEHNCKSEKGNDLFYTTKLGSGMDNTPRNNVNKAPWIDYSAQQALAALHIAKIAKANNDPETHRVYQGKYTSIKSDINKFLWSNQKQFYYDLTEADTLSTTMHIGAFWTLLSEVCPDEKLPNILSHLQDSNEFWRPHLVPTLAANQPEYDPKGHYWLGSVWAPTNYMLIKGLMANKETSLADKIATNHLEQIAEIYINFEPKTEKIAFNERFADSYHTLWECYSSELDEPATRWDNTFYSRQDFVGWTGIAPIALLIENVLGLEIVGMDNRINWDIKRTDKHGIKNIQLRNQKVTLVFETQNAVPRITINCQEEFNLDVTCEGKLYSFNITDIETVITLDTPD